MKRKEIVIVGAGTFAANVVSYLENDVHQKWEIIGLIDNNPEAQGQCIAGYKVIGSDDSLPGLFQEGVKYAALGIGTTAKFDMKVRKRIFEMLKKIKFNIATIISPQAVVHKSVLLGEGVIIPQYVVIDPEAKLGDNVVLSPFVYVPHHVVLGSHIFVSSFVNFVGGVEVKDESFIGMSSTICKSIGRSCTIHPQTLVLEDIEDDMIGFGNPMRKIPRSLFVR